MAVLFEGTPLKELEKEWQEEGLNINHGSVLMDCIIGKCQDYSDPNDWLYQDGHWDTLNEYLGVNTVDITNEVYLGEEGESNFLLNKLKINEKQNFDGSVTMWLKDVNKVDADPNDSILVLKGKLKGIYLNGDPKIHNDFDYILAPFSFKVTRIAGRFKYIEAV